MVRVSALACLAVGWMAVACLGGCTQQVPEVRNHQFGFDRIASFDVTRQGGRIHLLIAGKIGGDAHVRYTWSADGGRHWAASVPVDAGAPAPHGLGHGNDVQIAAASERLVAVWPAAGAGRGGAGPLASAFSLDGGQHWQPGPRPARGFSGGQGYADVKADGAGNFQLVWLDSRNGAQALYHARSDDGGQHWTDPDLVDAATCFCCANELAVAPSGGMLVLYRDAEPRDMILARLDGAGSWQRRGVVGDFDWHFKGCPEAGGSLVRVDGRLHALVWTGKPDAAGIYHLVSSDGGRSWGSPKLLAGPGNRDLTLAARDRNQIAAAWSQGGENGGVSVAISSDGGTHWSNRERVMANNALPHLLAMRSGWLLIMLHDHQSIIVATL